MSPQRSTEFWPGTVHRADACFDGASPKGGLPYVNDQGAFLGGGLPLLRRVGDAWQSQPPDRLASTLTETYGRPYTLDDGVRLAQRLASVAQALSEGKRALAAIAPVRVGLPPAEGATKAALAKAANDAWEDEARNDQGEWTTGGGAGETRSDEVESVQPSGKSGRRMANGFAGATAGQAVAAEKAIVEQADRAGGWLSSAPGTKPENGRECVSLVRAVSRGLGHVDTWREGERLTPESAKTLKPGTVVATFENGHYSRDPNHRHAGIFMRADKEGIWLLDQYNSHDKDGKPNNKGRVRERLYRYSKNGSKYQVSDFSTLAE
ncbi:BPSL0067 family protein [Azospirillum sp. B4]|uniref:BPSL0067 family protein n=1 Tax=Azospirillum sp. B4 TaxID=95605 RepID=UPI00131F02AC|nr:BPSL0067 family protein [Azospirillum sp. B4]